MVNLELNHPCFRSCPVSRSRRWSLAKSIWTCDRLSENASGSDLVILNHASIGNGNVNRVVNASGILISTLRCHDGCNERKMRFFNECETN